ncbi:hypothetical protein FZEAL_7884 [Fusarium zealandicum]|uniref:Restriction of telomere capping protein 4 n=1 Tax=Fusarium zealandicum TaxID=1053134 RepID=A0A8H4UF86_9HYPO|nr:hypothetical protein FZEAL_7884 [Fusarium zealandicum]
MKIRAGLSRNQKPQSLLSQVNGKVRRLAQPVKDVTAAPISSEDENDDEFRSSKSLSLKRSSSRQQSPAEASEDSSSEKPSRADIKPTSFGKSSTEKPRRNATRAASRPKGKQPLRDDDPEDTASSSSKRRKLDGEETTKRDNPGLVARSANHLKTEQGFTKTQTVRAKYGSKQSSRGSQGSQTRKGSTSCPVNSIVPTNLTAGQKGQKTTDSDSDDIASPQKPTKTKLKTIRKDSFESPKKSSKPTMKAAPEDCFDSPQKRIKNKIIGPKDELLSSPVKGSPARLIKHSQDDLGSTRSPKSSSQRSGRIKIEQQGPSSSQQSKPLWGALKTSKKKKKNAQPQSPKSEPVLFKAPAEIHDGGLDDGSSVSLSDLDLSSEPEAVEQPSSDEEEPLQSKTTPCPWCGDLVSESSLKEYSKGRRLTVQMQTNFCQKHKKATAMETWRERGYPHIDWAGLNGRFDDHRKYLLRVIDGKPSHFRDVLADRIETGQGRSLKKEGNLNPGYYGPRGCKLMCDYLVEEFTELLKEKAVSDRVIAGRGSAAFIQSVMVAELAVQLIMEDMDVSATEAREIMEESKVVGEMVHEEVYEV